jgi:dipeptidyl aminopeptidase/acylaminoacyl peptidase
LAGDPVPVIRLASTSRVTPSFAASANGTLVTTDAALSDLVEVAPDGSRRRPAVATGELSDPSLSRDGRFLAYTRGAYGSEQLWIHELATGRESRISEASRVSDPVWTPGGDVVYLDRSSTRFALRLVTPSRGGEPLTLLESDKQVVPFSVSPGGTLLFTSGYLGRQIQRLDLARPQHADVWLQGILLTVMFSPDGRWVAYERWSGKSGSRVYVRSFEGTGAERPASVDQGWAPMWASDGRTLYFKNLSGLMAVAAHAAGESLELGSPRPVPGGITANVYNPELDYTPVHDGEGFIVVTEADEPRGFTVITNLGRMLRDRTRARTAKD